MTTTALDAKVNKELAKAKADLEDQRRRIADAEREKEELIDDDDLVKALQILGARVRRLRATSATKATAAEAAAAETEAAHALAAALAAGASPPTLRRLRAAADAAADAAVLAGN